MQKVKIQIIEGCIDLWFNLSKKRFEMFKKLFYSNTCLIKTELPVVQLQRVTSHYCHWVLFETKDTSRF